MDIGQIAQLFHRAAIEAGSWMTALDALASTTNSYRGQLIGFGAPRAVPFNWATHLDDCVTEQFVAIGGSDPAINFRVAAGDVAAVGEMVDERHYTRFRADIGDGIYEAFCDEHDLPYGCQTVLARDSGRMIGLAVLRTRRDGRSAREERLRFGKLIPHVRAAVDLQMAIEGRGTALAQGSLDAIAAPALLIDAFGMVAGMTPAAEAALRTQPHLKISGGVIRCASPRDEARVMGAIGEVISNTAPSADILLRDGGGLPLRISVHRLSSTEWSLGFVPRAILVLRSGGGGSEVAGSLLRSAYGLTSAEVEIAMALRAGISRADSAASRRATLGTVRQQIKSIYAKLGIHREASLISLLAAIHG
ncbi:hypothetical protein BH09PSE4_BH09PSE4_08340 [soil metagenome]